jgi:hypothetical protein
VPQKKENLDVLREAMKAEEPTLAIDAVERRVPPHGLAYVGDSPRDERVEAVADVVFPARHGRDVGLHECVAIALRDLRVATCEKGRLLDGPLGGGSFATFADFLDVLPIVLTRKRRVVAYCANSQRTAARTCIGR